MQLAWLRDKKKIGGNYNSLAVGRELYTNTDNAFVCNACRDDRPCSKILRGEGIERGGSTMLMDVARECTDTFPLFHGLRICIYFGVGGKDGVVGALFEFVCQVH